MNGPNAPIPSEIRENKTYLLPLDETEGTILWHALTREINALNYQITSYMSMDFPDEVVGSAGKVSSALQWHRNQLVNLREKLANLKAPQKETGMATAKDLHQDDPTDRFGDTL